MPEPTDQYTGSLDSEVHEKMFRSSGESEARPPVFQVNYFRVVSARKTTVRLLNVPLQTVSDAICRFKELGNDGRRPENTVNTSKNHKLHRQNTIGRGLAFLINNINYQCININRKIIDGSNRKIQGIRIIWRGKQLKILNMYHPPNLKSLPTDLQDLFTVSTICLGDLNAKHLICGCSTANLRGNELLNIIDDKYFSILNDGRSTHFSYSYSTKEALDISITSSDLGPSCKWTLLENLGKDHLPILIELKKRQLVPTSNNKQWIFKKADWHYFGENGFKKNHFSPAIPQSSPGGAKLEKVQLSAARIITGLRNTCPRDIVLFEADLQSLSLRRHACLTKYYNKLRSLDSRNRTSAYVKDWCKNQRLRRNSSFSQMVSFNLTVGAV
ncbi:hypothetical protein TNCV_1125001 [Trichonephila clavipes]|uniref:Endonuclease/exonuclease/phosphatase domain-containing protein n=1 Tax=Trichonephila clavipes TaxID=2585209 RepID=A0A8X6SCH1_TRICX|nr:hypothetical protein TNCV_1125001 [Trichonephila clavipes]